ncbi:MAG TPA: hypothetical protein VGE63_02895 [Candidatus Paceibacterota bacterium]
MSLENGPQKNQEESRKDSEKEFKPFDVAFAEKLKSENGVYLDAFLKETQYVLWESKSVLKFIKELKKQDNISIDDEVIVWARLLSKLVGYKSKTKAEKSECATSLQNVLNNTQSPLSFEQIASRIDYYNNAEFYLFAEKLASYIDINNKDLVRKVLLLSAAKVTDVNKADEIPSNLKRVFVAYNITDEAVIFDEYIKDNKTKRESIFSQLISASVEQESKKLELAPNVLAFYEDLNFPKSFLELGIQSGFVKQKKLEEFYEKYKNGGLTVNTIPDSGRDLFSFIHMNLATPITDAFVSINRSMAPFTTGNIENVVMEDDSDNNNLLEPGSEEERLLQEKQKEKKIAQQNATRIGRMVQKVGDMSGYPVDHMLITPSPEGGELEPGGDVLQQEEVPLEVGESKPSFMNRIFNQMGNVEFSPVGYVPYSVSQPDDVIEPKEEIPVEAGEQKPSLLNRMFNQMGNVPFAPVGTNPYPLSVEIKQEDLKLTDDVEDEEKKPSFLNKVVNKIGKLYAQPIDHMGIPKLDENEEADTDKEPVPLDRKTPLMVEPKKAELKKEEHTFDITESYEKYGFTQQEILDEIPDLEHIPSNHRELILKKVLYSMKTAFEREQEIDFRNNKYAGEMQDGTFVPKMLGKLAKAKRFFGVGVKTTIAEFDGEAQDKLKDEFTYKMKELVNTYINTKRDAFADREDLENSLDGIADESVRSKIIGSLNELSDDYLKLGPPKEHSLLQKMGKKSFWKELGKQDFGDTVSTIVNVPIKATGNLLNNVTTEEGRTKIGKEIKETFSGVKKFFGLHDPFQTAEREKISFKELELVKLVESLEGQVPDALRADIMSNAISSKSAGDFMRMVEVELDHEKKVERKYGRSAAYAGASMSLGYLRRKIVGMTVDHAVAFTNLLPTMGLGAVVRFALASVQENARLNHKRTYEMLGMGKDFEKAPGYKGESASIKGTEEKIYKKGLFAWYGRLMNRGEQGVIEAMRKENVAASDMIEQLRNAIAEYDDIDPDDYFNVTRAQKKIQDLYELSNIALKNRLLTFSSENQVDGRIVDPELEDSEIGKRATEYLTLNKVMGAAYLISTYSDKRAQVETITSPAQSETAEEERIRKIKAQVEVIKSAKRKYVAEKAAKQASVSAGFIALGALLGLAHDVFGAHGEEVPPKTQQIDPNKLFNTQPGNPDNKVPYEAKVIPQHRLKIEAQDLGSVDEKAREVAEKIIAENKLPKDVAEAAGGLDAQENPRFVTDDDIAQAPEPEFKPPVDNVVIPKTASNFIDNNDQEIAPPSMSDQGISSSREALDKEMQDMIASQRAPVSSYNAGIISDDFSNELEMDKFGQNQILTPSSEKVEMVTDDDVGTVNTSAASPVITNRTVDSMGGPRFVTDDDGFGTGSETYNPQIKAVQLEDPLNPGNLVYSGSREGYFVDPNIVRAGLDSNGVQYSGSLDKNGALNSITKYSRMWTKPPLEGDQYATLFTLNNAELRKQIVREFMEVNADPVITGELLANIKKGTGGLYLDNIFGHITTPDEMLGTPGVSTRLPKTQLEWDQIYTKMYNPRIIKEGDYDFGAKEKLDAWMKLDGMVGKEKVNIIGPNEKIPGYFDTNPTVEKMLAQGGRVKGDVASLNPAERSLKTQLNAKLYSVNQLVIDLNKDIQNVPNFPGAQKPFNQLVVNPETMKVELQNSPIEISTPEVHSLISSTYAYEPGSSVESIRNGTANLVRAGIPPEFLMVNEHGKGLKMGIRPLKGEPLKNYMLRLFRFEAFLEQQKKLRDLVRLRGGLKFKK